MSETSMGPSRPSLAPDWIAARTEPFTAEDLARELGVSPNTADYHLRRALRAGVVREIGEGDRPRRFVAVNSTADRPAGLAAALTDGRQSPSSNCWVAMRLLRQFTPLDLAVHATTGEVEVGEAAAATYCQTLMRAGYLRVVDKARPGVRAARYRLVRDTGPRPPRERRVRCVWDDNLRALTHVPGVMR